MKDIVHLMKNNKGQALVEFVLLLPIIIFVIFVVVDFANVYYKKNVLEGMVSDISLLVSNKRENEITKMIDNPKIKHDISYDGEYAIITLKQEVNLVTPFSNVVLDNPFYITVERKIIYD